MDQGNSDRDAHIRAICWILGAFVLVSIAALFLGFAAFNMHFEDKDFDTIAIALAAVEVVLAVLAIILGLGALAGFWMIRGAAVVAARETAVTTAEKAGREFFQTYEPVISEADSKDSQDMIDALAKEHGGDSGD